MTALIYILITLLPIIQLIPNPIRSQIPPKTPNANINKFHKAKHPNNNKHNQKIMASIGEEISIRYHNAEFLGDFGTDCCGFACAEDLGEE